MKIGPIAFLLLVVVGWAAVRAVLLWPARSPAPRRVVAWAPPLPLATPSRPLPRRGAVKPVGADAVGVADATSVAVKGPPQRIERRAQRVATEATTMAGQRAPSDLAHIIPIAPHFHARPSGRSGVSISAWALVRADVRPGLATAGQLGGSQAGVRVRHTLAPGLHIAARVSGPLAASSGKEAALALDWRPHRLLPVTVTIERRIGLDRGGRDAFGLGVAGGFDHSPALGLRLDGYAQAGVVGLRRRDAYVDGALRIERDVGGAGRARTGFGAGLWGGAQPGAARLDIGPQFVLRVPVGAGGLRIGAEWRQRVAGDARPESGPALSIGADF